MGNDGGSIPHRAEMVKTKKKEERKESFAIAKAKAKLCAVSKDPLRQPIAVCRMGLLYNKEEVVKRLIEKNIPKAFRHIKKLRDIKEAKVQMRPDKKDGTNVIVCPVSQIEFNGFHPFLMLWQCGCVFSEEASKELKLSDKCINCGAAIESKSDIISLNQTSDQQQQYLKEFDEQQRIAEEKAQQKKNEKSKKRKHRENEEEEAEGEKKGDEDEKIGEGEKKRQKTDSESKIPLYKESEAFKSLFTKQYEEKKDSDFLCRCVHRGLR